MRRRSRARSSGPPPPKSRPRCAGEPARDSGGPVTSGVSFGDALRLPRHVIAPRALVPSHDRAGHSAPRVHGPQEHQADDRAARDSPTPARRWGPSLLELKPAVEQLEGYFVGAVSRFTLLLDPVGTEFQGAVWKELVRIPYGEKRTYGQIAKAIGQPRSARAVGLANNQNPIAIIVPCHRVIGANGSLTGYGGGLPRKRWLLQHEDRFARQGEPEERSLHRRVGTNGESARGEVGRRALRSFGPHSRRHYPKWSYPPGPITRDAPAFGCHMMTPDASFNTPTTPNGTPSRGRDLLYTARARRDRSRAPARNRRAGAETQRVHRRLQRGGRARRGPHPPANSIPQLGADAARVRELGEVAGDAVGDVDCGGHGVGRGERLRETNARGGCAPRGRALAPLGSARTFSQRPREPSAGAGTPGPSGHGDEIAGPGAVSRPHPTALGFADEAHAPPLGVVNGGDVAADDGGVVLGQHVGKRRLDGDERVDVVIASRADPSIAHDGVADIAAKSLRFVTARRRPSAAKSCHSGR